MQRTFHLAQTPPPHADADSCALFAVRSRAAGFRAVCELLLAVDNAPPLQSKLLATLDSVLQPSGGSDAGISDHYSRDCSCAGPHANGRLHVAFAALMEQLVNLLAMERGDAACEPPDVQQLRSLKCLMHCEIRPQDLPVLKAVRLLPTLHVLTRHSHGAIWAQKQQSSRAASESVRASEPSTPSRDSPFAMRDTLGGEGSGDSRQLPHTLQLLFQTFVSRLFATQHAEAKRVAKSDGGAAAPALFPLRSTVGRADATGRTLTIGAATRPATFSSSSMEEFAMEALEINLRRATARMREDLTDATASVLGAATASDGWQMAEGMMHSTLALFFQLVAGIAGLAFSLARQEEWLSALFGALHVGSLRCVRLIVRSFRHILPHVAPEKLAARLYLDEGGGTGASAALPEFADFLLTLIGDGLAGEVARDVPVLRFSRSLWRNAHVSAAVASEAVSLAQHLLVTEAWAQSVHAALRRALLDVPGVVRTLQEEVRGSVLLADNGLLPAALRAVAAFCVTGGSLPSLYVGCRVIVVPEHSSTLQAAEHGILAKWDGADDSAAMVLLGSDFADLRRIEVSVLRLLPVEDAPLPPSCFTLTPEMVPSFAVFLPKRMDGDTTATQPTALQSNFLFGLLQTRALKALRGLLLHLPAMSCVLRCGLFPSIMASAATPVPLVGSHTTEALQGHVVSLEHMHMEAASAARSAKAFALAASRRVQGSDSRLTGDRMSANSTYAPTEGSGESTPVAPFRRELSQLAEMGFEYTLCQKAVGMFGHDLDSAISWLSSEQAEAAKVRRLHRSPSWQMAETLAQAIHIYSVFACKKALERNGNDSNAAAMWLLEHGAQAEEEVEAVADADDVEVDEARAPTGPDQEVGEEAGDLMRTASFTPQAQSAYRLESPRAAGQQLAPLDSAKSEGNIADHWTLNDEVSATRARCSTPPPARYSTRCSCLQPNPCIRPYLVCSSRAQHRRRRILCRTRSRNRPGRWRRLRRRRRWPTRAHGCAFNGPSRSRSVTCRPASASWAGSCAQCRWQPTATASSAASSGRTLAFACTRATPRRTSSRL